LSFIGNKKGRAGIFMKISKKLIIMLFGILLIGCVLNGAVKRKNPVINDKRRELVFKKFNCNKKIYTVNYITDETVQLLNMKTYKKRLLDRVVSANGERYGDENVKIHIKGSHMTLTQNGKNTSCFLVK
jgi:putative outer membrane o protein